MDTNLIGLAGVPIIVALVELVKRTVPELGERWWPLLAVAFGEALNLGLAYGTGSDLLTAGVLGLVAGLAASGLYSGGKALVEKS